VTTDIDRCLMVSMPGTTISPDLAAWLERGLGGVILFGQNITGPEQLADLVAELRQHSPDLLIGVDEEGGDVSRLEHPGGSSYPGNLALGEVDDVALTARVAGSIADLVAAAGISIDFAPVADVNTNPLNPVIGPRAFGADPDLVARHTAAFVEGLQSRGIAACAKHFPGHGGTALDSHLDLPTVERTREQTAEIDLVPFRAAVAAGVKMVMTAHVVHPGWDDRPATLSRTIMTDLLRGELGFDGVIITDGMRMAAIREGIGCTEGAVQALSAGVDLLCIDLEPGEQWQVREAIADAVDSGRLPAARVAEAARRVDALCGWTDPTPAGPADRAVGLEAARRALRVDTDLPVRRPLYVIDAGVRVRPGIGVTSPGLLDVLTAIEPTVSGVRVTEPPSDLDAVIASADRATPIVAVRDAHRRPWQADLVRRVVDARPDCVVVGTGTAADADLAPGRYVGALGCGQVNLRAVAERLFGTPAGHAR
jgi:beta-N-acetylhexosaminidase